MNENQSMTPEKSSLKFDSNTYVKCKGKKNDNIVDIDKKELSSGLIDSKSNHVQKKEMHKELIELECNERIMETDESH